MGLCVCVHVFVCVCVTYTRTLTLSLTHTTHPPSLPSSSLSHTYRHKPKLGLRTSQLADKENEIRMPPDLNTEKQPSPSEPTTPVTVKDSPSTVEA